MEILSSELLQLFLMERIILEYLERSPASDAEEEIFFTKYGSDMIEGIRMFKKWVTDIRDGSFRFSAP